MTLEVDDWVGLWFETWEAEGEFARHRFGRIELSETEPRWTLLARSLHDGIGGLAQLLADSGITVRELPRLQRHASLSPAIHLAAFERLQQRRPISPARWLSFDETWRPLLPEVARPTAVAFELLTRNETELASKRAAEERVPLDIYLLTMLNRVVAPWLDGSGPMLWDLPVNLRGGLERASPMADHTSSISVEAHPDLKPKGMLAVREAALTSGEHLGMWHHVNLGREVGAVGLRALIRAWGEFGVRVGVFSDLGDWPPGETWGHDDGGWLHAPMVTRYAPFGAGTVTFRGRLSLTVHAHPALCALQSDVRRWVDAWRDAILD